MLDLGSGIGFLPLCLASKGYNVISTDISLVIESVLRENVQTGLRAIYNSPSTIFSEVGKVDVVELDWEEVYTHGRLPDTLRLTHEQSESSSIDIITTTDTLYSPRLVQPLLTTLRLISVAQNAPMIVYIGLERRDTTLVDSALKAAMEAGLVLKKVGRGRMEKALGATRWGWSNDDWEGVEIWKGRFKQV